jgi:hypothetical protein
VALDELAAACPSLTLDGEPNPSRAQLADRLGSYWIPDEDVLYIGLAGQPLQARVRQYYKTPLGAAKPHKGGWWLKTLSALNDLHMHFAVTSGYKDAEEGMLRTFAAALSESSWANLPAGDPVTPFANLRDGEWYRRKHGIGNATSAVDAGRPSSPGPPAPAAPRT